MMQTLSSIFEAENSKSEKWELWSNWYRLVNMSASELKSFMETEDGKEAGLSKSEADKEGISSGRESARWLLKMIPIGQSWNSANEKFTPKMWEWVGKQVSFISRMRGVEGALYDDKGNRTRKHTSLLIWGHDPQKKMKSVPKKPKKL